MKYKDYESFIESEFPNYNQSRNGEENKNEQ